MRLICLIFCSLFFLCSCGSSPEAGGRLFERGRKAAQAGESGEACRLLEQAVLSGDNALQAHYYLGGVYEKQDAALTMAIWHYQQFLEKADLNSPEARAAGIRLDILEKKYLRILREKWEGAIDADKEFRIGLLEERNGILKENLQRVNEENYALRQLLLEEKKGRSRQAVAATVSAVEPPRPRPVKSSSLRMHRVAAGDTIGKIASHYYGSSRMEFIRKILSANRENLPNPDRLRIGQMLVIPR